MKACTIVILGLLLASPGLGADLSKFCTEDDVGHYYPLAIKVAVKEGGKFNQDLPLGRQEANYLDGLITSRAEKLAKECAARVDEVAAVESEKALLANDVQKAAAFRAAAYETKSLQCNAERPALLKKACLEITSEENTDGRDTTAGAATPREATPATKDESLEELRRAMQVQRRMEP